MKLSKFKQHLAGIQEPVFMLPTGAFVPGHYHITEVGQITKNFIDCGGTIRKESTVNFQLWYSDDLDHRLQAEKLLNIISIAEDKLGLEDAEIEVEYQGATIGKYGLDFENDTFLLVAKSTDCLAPDKCEIPVVKEEISLSELVVSNNTCKPGSGCC